jgi:hypothetical protein
MAFVIFLMNMLCVDFVTTNSKSRGESSHTIRGLKGPAGLKYLMSAAQFHANVNCLVTSHKMSVQFAALTVVQSSAFGMTLRRKGRINHGQGLVLYSLVLILGMLVIGQDLLERGSLLTGLTLGNVAAIVRIDFGLNKYALWCLIAVVALPNFLVEEQEHGEHPFWLFFFAGSSTAALLTSAALHQLQHVQRK